ncbi:hypothetical protein ACN9ML_29455 [Dyadobacter endophyticus]|uniref:hypothetical protein n=1 Tax=Dyadobacter endophyticus TaxID=1749036 RepID=UPI003CF79457
MKELEKEFESELLALYRLIKKEVYDPKRFYKMIGSKGAINAARELLNEKKIHSGFAELILAKRLDLTVEAFVLRNEKYHMLFEPQMLLNAKIKVVELNR